MLRESQEQQEEHTECQPHQRILDWMHATVRQVLPNEESQESQSPLPLPYRLMAARMARERGNLVGGLWQIVADGSDLQWGGSSGPQLDRQFDAVADIDVRG